MNNIIKKQNSLNIIIYTSVYWFIQNIVIINTIAIQYCRGLSNIYGVIYVNIRIIKIYNAINIGKQSAINIIV